MSASHFMKILWNILVGKCRIIQNCVRTYHSNDMSLSERALYFNIYVYLVIDCTVLVKNILHCCRFTSDGLPNIQLGRPIINWGCPILEEATFFNLADNNRFMLKNLFSLYASHV